MFQNNVVISDTINSTQSSKDKTGQIGDLSKLSLVALLEILERQNKLLSDSYISNKVASAVALLNHFSVGELRAIMNEQPKFDDFMKDVIESKEMETDKEVLIASNKSLAEFNLTKESTLNELKRDIIEISRSGEQLYQEVEGKLNRFTRNSGSNNLEDVLALLQSATATIEEESESLVESFLNGDSDVDAFLEQFINKRELMHLRRVKADKMKEMIQRRLSRIDYNSINSNFVPRFPVQPVLFPSSNNALPYPMGPVSDMPLPAMNKFNNYY